MTDVTWFNERRHMLGGLVSFLRHIFWRRAQVCFYRPLNCVQLLGELLLDRHNFTVMTKYISRAENLKLMMNMLRDNSRNIQFEAFHVFKVCSVFGFAYTAMLVM